MAYSAHTFRDLFRSHDVPFALAPDEQRAIGSLPRVRGNALATPYLAPALPALAGLTDGQVTTTREKFFDGRVREARAQWLIDRDRITVVVSDCMPGRKDLSGLLQPLGFSERRYSYARAYVRKS